MDKVRRVDAERLDDPARLSVFGGAVLERDLDAQLQAIADEAARVTGFGIALVSLVLRRVQFFRAHVGLPKDLQISQSTDRCVSFCQFVVSAGKALEIEDAATSDFLPQELVKRYGIRAYAGEPVYIGEHIAGTLCVIDGTPRRLSDDQRTKLHDLAKRVSDRLSELATVGVSTSFIGRAMRPVFGEVDNALTSMMGCTALLRLGTADLTCIVNTVKAAASGELTPKERDRVLSVLIEAEESTDDINARSNDLDNLIRRVARNIDAVRLLVAQTDAKGTAVAEGIAAADTLAAHITKLIGGVRYCEVSPVLRVGTLRVVFISLLSISLRLLADALHTSSASEGIDVDVKGIDASPYVTIHISAPAATESTYRSVAQLVDEHSRDAAGIAITSSNDCLILTFPS